MKYTNTVRILISAAAIACIISVIGLTANGQDKAQDKSEAKASETPLEKSAGRDPFRKYSPVVKPPKGSAARLEAPPIQVRIERYRQLRAAAASAHVAAPKPTTAWLVGDGGSHAAQSQALVRDLSRRKLLRWPARGN